MTSVERFLAALPGGPGGFDGPRAARLGTELVGRWSEPHRSYHNLRHLDAVLSIVDANAGLARDPAAVRLAAWFHDAVYDPTAPSGSNEEASADLARAELEALGVPDGLGEEVARLVRLTAGHDADPGDPDGCLLADADLAILASEPDRYDEYAAAIRREYHHVPDRLFRLGRATVLRHLLGLPELYRVVPARAEWTARARANIERELAGRAG